MTCRPGLAGRVCVRACRAHFPNPRSQLRGEQHPHPPPAGTDVRQSGSDGKPRGPHAGLWDPEKVPLGRAALGSGQGLWGPWGRNSVQAERWAEGLGQRGEPRGESVSGSGSGKWRGAGNAVTPGHALPGPRGSAAGAVQPRRDGAPFGSLRMPSPDEGTAPRFSHFGVLRSVPSRPLSWGPRHSHAVTAPHPGLRPRHRREKPVSLGDMHGFSWKRGLRGPENM